MNRKQRDLVYRAIEQIEPWTTFCDYRAEPALQVAMRLLNEALKIKTGRRGKAQGK